MWARGSLAVHALAHKNMSGCESGGMGVCTECGCVVVEQLVAVGVSEYVI
jgi:transcription initiation factor TFIIIB Brf1 subunit/transcription initiation factor TFIIB